MLSGPDRPSTLSDVAERVGVSPKTVSRVVRDEGGFSEATRQRVLRVVDELNYRPNAQARGLISGRSGTIAFVSPVLSDPFFPELADGVQRAAQELGLTVLLATTQADRDQQRSVLDSLEAHRPDGLVIFPARDSDDVLRPFLDRGMPMVVVDSQLDHANAVSVCSDLAAGTRAAVSHLVQRGCRRLAMLGDHTLDENDLRSATFRSSAPRSALPFVMGTDITMAGGRAAMAELLDHHPEVDGVFCYNDVLAIGALQAVADAGLRVPDDIAVIGFDDIAMGAVVAPSLTTVRIDRSKLGSEAVRQLVALSNGSPIDRSVVLPVELVLRESA